MSILIKGMEMPKSCYDCDFAYQDQDSEHNVYWTCAAVHKSACMHERREDCPLVPVPPHGRLIDADRLKRNIYANLPVAVQDICPGFCNIVDMQKTVIESEGD